MEKIEKFTEEGYERLLAELKSKADGKYRAFHARLLPTGTALLGVRTPELKAIAAEIAAGDWRGYLALCHNGLYEERILQGLVIAAAAASADERIWYLEQFLPRIDNWAICDIAAAALDVSASPAFYYKKALEWAERPAEYEARFGLAVLVSKFVAKENLADLFRLADRLPCKEPYAQVGLAWLISVCFAAFPADTAEYLRTCRLEEETFRKTVRKINESSRVGMEDKHAVRLLRREGRE